MNGIPSINNGHGDNKLWHRPAINADNNTRAYSLMYFKVGGNPGEVVVNGNAAAGSFAGINQTLPPEPIRTNTIENMSTAGVGAKNLDLALAPSRINVWAAPNTTFVEGGYLIADGSDRVMPAPNGTTQELICQSLESKTTGADPELIWVEVLAPYARRAPQSFTGFGLDTPGAVDQWLKKEYANHTAAGTPAALHVMDRNGKVSRLFIKLKTAPGAGKSLTYTLKRSQNGGATWADTGLTVTIADTATSAVDEVASHNVNANQGDLLGIAATGVVGGPAANAGVSGSFQVE